MTIPSPLNRTYHRDGTLPVEGEVFVFGSNESGVHGAGAAKAARSYGAQYGVGSGYLRQSYGIPTKDYNLLRLDLNEIGRNVWEFVEFTHEHPELKFFVTSVGCGLAGNRIEDIAPLFRHAINCSFPDTWEPFLTF